MGPGSILAERFEVVRALARGGMAEIFEGRDIAGAGGKVAIKVLRDDLSKNKEAIARFHREARIASTLESRHVVKILDFGVTDRDWPFLVMEFLRGNDLADEIRRRAPLPLSEALLYAAQAARGIAAAHAAGVIHRDLKPTNLFLADQADRRIIKILDFGIAKLRFGESDQITLTGAIFGSPLYMSPEAFRAAKDADARSDVWSLGVILYEMLTGVTPFHGDHPLTIGLAVTRDSLVAPSLRRSEITRHIDDVVCRALEKEPDVRYPTIVAFLDAIEAVLERHPAALPVRISDKPVSPAPRANADLDDPTLVEIPFLAEESSADRRIPVTQASEPDLAVTDLRVPSTPEEVERTAPIKRHESLHAPAPTTVAPEPAPPKGTKTTGLLFLAAIAAVAGIGAFLVFGGQRKASDAAPPGTAVAASAPTASARRVGIEPEDEEGDEEPAQRIEDLPAAQEPSSRPGGSARRRPKKRVKDAAAREPDQGAPREPPPPRRFDPTEL